MGAAATWRGGELAQSCAGRNILLLNPHHRFPRHNAFCCCFATVCCPAATFASSGLPPPHTGICDADHHIRAGSRSPYHRIGQRPHGDGARLRVRYRSRTLTRRRQRTPRSWASEQRRGWTMSSTHTLGLRDRLSARACAEAGEASAWGAVPAGLGGDAVAPPLMGNIVRVLCPGVSDREVTKARPEGVRLWRRVG